MQKLMREYWKERNTYGCKWKVTKPTIQTPGYVMVWKGNTLVRTVYSDGFKNADVRSILDNITRLEKVSARNMI